MDSSPNGIIALLIALIAALILTVINFSHSALAL